MPYQFVVGIEICEEEFLRIAKREGWKIIAGPHGWRKEASPPAGDNNNPAAGAA